MKTEIIFPEVFHNPETVEYEEDNAGRALAIADGLCGWAGCSVGAKMPCNFGAGMVKIKKRLGSALPNDLIKMAETLVPTIDK